MARSKLLSIRVHPELDARLEASSGGAGKSNLAQRYIDEGLRMDQHPGIVFRPGPAGRRAGLAGGPDVWEVIRVVRNSPESGDGSVAAAAQWLELPPRLVEIAVRYYADHRDEIDAWIARVDREAAEAEGASRRRQDALA